MWVVLCWQQTFIRSAATESRDVCSEEPGSACGQGTIRRPCAACKGCSSCLGTGGDLQEVRAAHRLQELGCGLVVADHHKNITKKHQKKNKTNKKNSLYLSLLVFQRMLASVAAVCVHKACAKLAML